MIATIILLVFQFIGFGIYLAKDGEDKGKYNVFHYIIAIFITNVLYYYAGLFDKFL